MTAPETGERECTCGRAWEGHPNPHAITCPLHRARVAMTAPDCDVTDCGTARCDTCDERLSCLGPEPRACGLTCSDCPCSCATCTDQREDLRAELLNQLERDAR